MFKFFRSSKKNVYNEIDKNNKYNEIDRKSVQRAIFGDKSDTVKLEIFNNSMEFAKDVLEKSNKLGLSDSATHPLIDVVRALGRKVQAEYMAYKIYSSDDRYRMPDASYFEFFFLPKSPLTSDNRWLHDIIIETSTDKVIKLNRDLIFPWPWNRDRLITNISAIGEGKNWGRWRQDKLNHNVELWLPLGISWVNGGNHSITAGILQGVGEIKPQYVFDISKVYEYVICDGLYYRRIEDNSIISRVEFPEFAAIFEIGRLMVDRGISW